MPNNTPPPAQPRAPVPAPAQPSVTKPKTSDERAKAKLEALKNENDSDRVKRRAKELQQLADTHMETISNLKERYPVPQFGFRRSIRGTNYSSLTEAERLRWHQRRDEINKANQAYHLSVRRVCDEHRNENAYLAQLRAEAAKAKAAEAEANEGAA